MTSPRPSTVVRCGLGVALVLAAAGCGSNDTITATTATAGSATPSAVPALSPAAPESVAPAAPTAARTRTGDLELLPTAPAGSDGVTGQVTVVEDTAAGTTVTLAVTGLVPGKVYVSHLHAGSCAMAGGPHFRFDPNGPAKPPNEVHLPFTAGADGSGSGTVMNQKEVGDGAKSYVIHPKDAMKDKVACADLAL